MTRRPIEFLCPVDRAMRCNKTKYFWDDPDDAEFLCPVDRAMRCNTHFSREQSQLTVSMPC